MGRRSSALRALQGSGECSRDARGTVVVDDAGRVLGTVVPGAFIVADLPPGDHAFFAEDVLQLDSGCVTDCLAFGAARARLAAGRTYGVLVEHPNRFSIGNLFQRHQLDLVRATPRAVSANCRSGCTAWRS